MQQLESLVRDAAATADLSGIDIALFSAGGATSKALAPTYAAAAPARVAKGGPNGAPGARLGRRRPVA